MVDGGGFAGDAGLGRADQMASVVSGYVAVVSLPIAVFSLLVANRQANPAPVDAAALLADGVRRQWVAEAALQRVHQPMPLPVRWSSTGRPVAADREVVFDEPGVDWQRMPMSGDVEEIVEAFRSLPHRQLVVLGEPGAGKSVLAMVLTLGWLKDAGDGQPVPVLLSIASWNPEVEPLDAFVARRVEDDYRFPTGRDVDGRSLANRLVYDGEVLAILDGLDELPAASHKAAHIER